MNFPIRTPLRKIPSMAYFSILLNPFATKKEIYGHNGNPCMSPLEGLNKLEANLFIRIEKFTLITHSMIHFITLKQKPLHKRSSERNVHEILS